MKYIIIFAVILLLSFSRVTGDRCDHQWTKGPFYITAAANINEEIYGNPGEPIPVMHCRLCGVLRVYDNYKSITTSNMDHNGGYFFTDIGADTLVYLPGDTITKVKTLKSKK